MSQKTLEYYKGLQYPIILEIEEYEGEKWYIAYTLEFGKYACFGKSENPEAAVLEFNLEKDAFIEYLYSKKKPIPEPHPALNDKYSGTFTVRTSPVIHSSLAQQSRLLGVSINLYVNQILSAGVAQQDMAAEVKETMAFFCNKLDKHHLEVTNQLKYTTGNVEAKSMSYLLAGTEEFINREIA